MCAPVTVDELQIAVAETYDVIVTPPEPRAYTLVAESWDRSGMARATLAPAMGMVAAVPALRPRPLATMKDMGMGGMDHGGGGGGACPPEHAAMGHCQPMGGAMPMDHGGMSHKMRDFANAPACRARRSCRRSRRCRSIGRGSRPRGGAMSGTGC
ncbi:Copper resistance protein A precursor [Sphingomonas paucimobilis]|nr:Copper resistance protein A precursor [Sphingomonas paucimobilis]